MEALAVWPAQACWQAAQTEVEEEVEDVVDEVEEFLEVELEEQEPKSTRSTVLPFAVVNQK